MNNCNVFVYHLRPSSCTSSYIPLFLIPQVCRQLSIVKIACCGNKCLILSTSSPLMACPKFGTTKSSLRANKPGAVNPAPGSSELKLAIVRAGVQSGLICV